MRRTFNPDFVWIPSLGRAPQAVRDRRDGVALVIILAFVVLLTGLIIAFFSRSLLDRQISNSSASQAKVSAFADGAASAIIADLDQEIAAGSVRVTTSIPAGSGTASTTVYIGGSGSTANQTFVLELVVSTGSAGEENLVKESKFGSSFFGNSSRAGYYNFQYNTVTTVVSGTAVISSATNTVAYPASNRAASVSSTTASLNGRYCTPARWNEPLLLPVTSGTDYTPALTSGTFTPPDWILVARDGSNPAIANLSGTNSQYVTNGTNPVVGRYAYAIYNEGGLLDANVAGFPSTSSAAEIGSKPALSYADLRQIPGGLSGTAVDALVAWRNYASIPVPGASFLNPNFAATAASGSNYFNLIVSNTTGFLSASGAAPVNGQTDQMFASRQQLIRFAQNALGLSGTNLNTLNYLTHFSRAVEQPTYSPDPGRPRTKPYDANCSTVAPPNGTPPSPVRNPDLATDDTGSNTAGGNDDSINPSFLQVMVTGSFTRNNGMGAVPGEPLVKTRFDLLRLAWITYKGPLSDGKFGGVATSAVQVNSTDPDLTLMAQYLNQYYGLSYAFLQQGTKQNVYNYFGLSWISKQMYDETGARSRWLYNHSNPNSSGPFASDPGTGQIIQHLQSLTGSREPDFFELLKAGDVCGSKAKASRCLNNTGAGQYSSNSYYYKEDTDLEFAIIQLGANIIDQFDLDGFATDILYNDGGLPERDFYGVESLPYLYGVSLNLVQGDLTQVSGTNVTNTGYFVDSRIPSCGIPTIQIVLAARSIHQGRTSRIPPATRCFR